ncbi:GTP 3',8-cyclase MoaA [Chitinimonas sp. PSY-7]|uniref:GTP 3',8-cyclase MoaA n=1 Tax=Chitinimonas sp. PSY-7 TaxID=3459088 RepID=UPI0040400B0B
MLIDRYGRRIDYLRLSVTDRCDLRCTYCMPKGFNGFEEPEHWLSFDEIERVVAAFARLGVGRVRLTGGEPLLRRDLPVLAARLSRLPGMADLSLSTNATQLGRHAGALKQAGVNRLNISLDSLQSERIATIAGRDVLSDVLAGLAAAQAEGFQPIKLNMVVQPGVNDDEIEAMVRFSMEHRFILRLIETMPIGTTGQQSGFLDLQQVLKSLSRQFDLVPSATELGGGPARYWQSRDGEFTLGAITPISQHFCATCNRVRLSVDGTLYLCLGQNDKLALRPLLRSGASDEELEQAIRDAISLKPERHEFREQPSKVIRFMSATGG